MSEDRRSRFEDRESRFDRAIDGAVRQMLDLEPRADLRNRVMRRISESDQRRKILWTAVPLGAAAMLSVAILLPRQAPVAPAPGAPRTEPGRAQASAPQVTPPITHPVIRSTPRTVDKPRQAAAPAPQPAPQPAPERMVIATVAPAETTIAIEPLDDVVAIQVAGIGATTIGLPEVAVTPLRQVTQLQISPLSTPEGRF